MQKKLDLFCSLISFYYICIAFLHYIITWLRLVNLCLCLLLPGLLHIGRDQHLYFKFNI